jgi:beta-galactosidase GanA
MRPIIILISLKKKLLTLLSVHQDNWGKTESVDGHGDQTHGLVTKADTRKKRLPFYQLDWIKKKAKSIIKVKVSTIEEPANSFTTTKVNKPSENFPETESPELQSLIGALITSRTPNKTIIKQIVARTRAGLRNRLLEVPEEEARPRHE